MSFKKRTKTLTSGGWQAYEGPGVLLAAVMDGTSLSSNVLTLYDTAYASITDPFVPPTISTWTQDTDFGTTVPVTVFQDGSVVATLATESANTHKGVEFFDGLFINKTGDTTHTAALTLIIKPLIKKSINIQSTGTTGDVRLFTGTGRVQAVRTLLATNATSTLDIILKDNTRSLITATNYTSAGHVIFNPVTTTGIDDAGTAVTTAATGAYANDGVYFLDDLRATWAQGTADRYEGRLDVLVDAG